MIFRFALFCLIGSRLSGAWTSAPTLPCGDLISHYNANPYHCCFYAYVSARRFASPLLPSVSCRPRQITPYALRKAFRWLEGSVCRIAGLCRLTNAFFWLIKRVCSALLRQPRARIITVDFRRAIRTFQEAKILIAWFARLKIASKKVCVWRWTPVMNTCKKALKSPGWNVAVTSPDF